MSPATSSKRATKLNPRKVVAVVYNQLCTFEYAVAVEVFGTGRKELPKPYLFKTVSIDPVPIKAQGGIQVQASTNLRQLNDAGTIILPGWRDLSEKPPQRLLNALVKAHKNGARILSFCSGVFVLAASGLLDGKKATTHWRYTEELTRQYPQILVERDLLYVNEQSIMTAAGSAAAIDLSLFVVRQDFGAEVANALARRMVVPPHREGGQAQFIASPMARPAKDSMSEILDWLRSNLDQEHTVESVAKHFHLSPRTLSRRFIKETGTSPHRWLLRERTFRAQQLLETSDHDVEHIASQCGFGSSQLLRFHFRRTLGTSPRAYRNTFRASATG